MENAPEATQLQMAQLTTRFQAMLLMKALTAAASLSIILPHYSKVL